uniref:Prefoldin subunit 4 n=1 Tax=Amblyomma aureolatum TaxID=187763 RepID=A0A1E1X039_9ACAR
MAASLRRQPEGDVQVTAKDQEMINNFARQNARLEDATEEMKQLEKELHNLEDAADEILMVEDDIPIPYQLGDVFVNLDSEEAQQMLEQAKAQNKERTGVLEEETRTIKGIMAELKSQLYNKFGNNINLEPDDS